MDSDAGSEIDPAYHLTRASWNKAYATEAVVAVLAWGLGLRDGRRVTRERRVVAGHGERGDQYEGTAAYYGLERLKKYGAERGQWKPPETG
jgi:RimJ/RimL family protein N-acetyltransferase